MTFKEQRNEAIARGVGVEGGGQWFSGGETATDRQLGQVGVVYE